MRRLAATLSLALGCLGIGAAAQAMPGPDPAPANQSAVGSWAEPQIRAVVARGLMGGDLSTFRPSDRLTLAELSELVSGLRHPTSAPAPEADPPAASPRVTIAGLNARLVTGLGLSASATRFLTGARDAGLTPPARFGAEATARLLGLRTNHPAANDDLELLPSDPATRAEGAYSAARMLQLGAGDVQALKTTAATFTLPELTDWQGRVLDIAFGFIGYPYVWGGASESSEAPFGVRAPGGFDCSGFVWRVYKLEAYDGGTALAATLKGRTTYAMSGEVAKTRRIPFAKLQPADIVFFGDSGPKSSPSQVGHMGIYVGGGWFIHSSEYGVALARLSGWYRDRFAWGRRPLAEAGLQTPA
jgi:hypothetical protein